MFVCVFIFFFLNIEISTDRENIGREQTAAGRRPPAACQNGAE
jgi:hypothetical protein